LNHGSCRGVDGLKEEITITADDIATRPSDRGDWDLRVCGDSDRIVGVFTIPKALTESVICPGVMIITDAVVSLVIT
jgi:hypothetical protein